MDGATYGGTGAAMLNLLSRHVTSRQKVQMIGPFNV